MNNKNALSLSTLEESLAELRAGRPIILIDNENRENEGDIVMAAQFITPEWINFMATEARGLICTPIIPERAKELNLPPMVMENQSGHETAFTVSIDSKIDTTTGISSSDRAKTVAQLCSPVTKASDFARPGHIFPLIAKDFGVLVREGHTEASIDLCKLAGLYPCAVICEIMNEDGTMSRLPELKILANKWGLKILTIASLKNEMIKRSQLLELKSECKLPTKYGQLQLRVLTNTCTNERVLILSNPHQKSSNIRIHSSCMTSEVFGSLRCDCSEQLQYSMGYISQHGGHIIYLEQEGRGIGLEEKIKAYTIQDSQGLDTIDANIALGHPTDKRTYENAYFAIKWLGLQSIVLLSNNPLKGLQLKQWGIGVQTQGIAATPNKFNSNYLTSKVERLGHHTLLESIHGDL